MPSAVAAVDKPRKQPSQARSTVTVEAILDAVIQVLVAEGKDRLTTTRVAVRAGVSVGTLYQYFPNKRSLLQATLRRKLELVAVAVETSCREHHGKPLRCMLEGVTAAFFRAKMSDAAGSLALYAIGSDVDGMHVAEAFRQRSAAALVEAIESSSQGLTVPVSQAAFVIQAAMMGTSRHILETRVPVREHAALQAGLVTMLVGYVDAVTAAAAGGNSRGQAVE